MKHIIGIITGAAGLAALWRRYTVYKQVRRRVGEIARK